MRILDESGMEIFDPNESLGTLTEETIVVMHHDPIVAVPEVGHYVVLAEYTNGGKDVEWVVDVEAVEPKEAWDETERILRWHPYSEGELAEMRAEQEAVQAALEAAEREEYEAARQLAYENALLKAQVAALIEHQLFLEDCIVEMAEIVYA